MSTKCHHMKDFWIYKLWFDYSHFIEESLRQREWFCPMTVNGGSKKVLVKHSVLDTLLMLSP